MLTASLMSRAVVAGVVRPCGVHFVRFLDELTRVGKDIRTSRRSPGKMSLEKPAGRSKEMWFKVQSAGMLSTPMPPNHLVLRMLAARIDPLQAVVPHLGLRVRGS